MNRRRCRTRRRLLLIKQSWEGSVCGWNGTAQIAFLAIQVALEIFDTGLRQAVHAHGNQVWNDAPSRCPGGLEAAFGIAKFDPVTLCLNEKLLGIRVIRQAGFDLPVKLIEPLVGFLERSIGALVHGGLTLGICAFLYVLSEDEGRRCQNNGGSHQRSFH